MVLGLEVRTIGHGTSWAVSSRERRESRGLVRELASAVSVSCCRFVLRRAYGDGLTKCTCEMSSIVSDSSSGLRHWLSSVGQFGGARMGRAVPKIAKRVEVTDEHLKFCSLARVRLIASNKDEFERHPE